MLAIPELDKKIRMEVNVLDHVTKRVWLMECENKK